MRLNLRDDNGYPLLMDPTDFNNDVVAALGPYLKFYAECRALHHDSAVTFQAVFGAHYTGSHLARCIDALEGTAAFFQAREEALNSLSVSAMWNPQIAVQELNRTVTDSTATKTARTRAAMERDIILSAYPEKAA